MQGVNGGDSKLVATNVKIEATQIDCRRIKSDTCSLTANSVSIGSSLESVSLRVSAGNQGFFVKKRLGINGRALIDSLGLISISSLYSGMLDLPQPQFPRALSCSQIDETLKTDLSRTTFNLGGDLTINNT